MRTVISEEQHEGVIVRRSTYSWSAGASLPERDVGITLKIAEVNRQAAAEVRGFEWPGAKVGRIVLTPPNVVLPVYATDFEGKYPVTVLELENDWLKFMLRDMFPVDLNDIQPDVNFYSSDIVYHAERIIGEIERRDRGYGQAIARVASLMAIDLGRYVIRSEKAKPRSRGGFSDRQIQLIDSILQSDNIGSLSATTLARNLDLGTSTFRQMFKIHMGRSFRDFMMGMKIERARALLRDNSLPLKEISFRVGFSHIGAFCFAFKRATGETPSEFRKHNMSLLTKAN